MYKIPNQQATPTKKTTVFNRNRTPLGIKSANAAVELPPVVVNKFTDDSTHQQVKSDEEIARRLQNSIDDDATQFQFASSSSSSNRPFLKPKKIKKSVQSTLSFDHVPRKPRLSEDRPEIVSELDRSAAANAEPDLPSNSQNSNEFNLTQLKTTAGMKRMNDSTNENEVEVLKIIRKRIKEDETDDPAEDEASASTSAPHVGKTMDKRAHVDIKSTRDRAAKHDGVKSVSIDLFSAVLYRFIYVSKELALKPIKGFAKTFKIPFSVVIGKLVLKTLSKAERASLIRLLKERMAIYDVGVSLDLVENLLDPTKWTAYEQWWVCLSVGEVMNSSGKLLGCLRDDRMVIKARNNTLPQRYNIVLLASGQARPSPNHTADHKTPSQPLNDSITNLRWATKSQQKLNQDAPVPSATFKTATGTFLPAHPNWGKKFKLTSDGLIKVGDRDWYRGKEDKTGDYRVKIDGSLFNVHVLIVECILGRVLTDAESTDHINGVHGSNLLTNLAPLFKLDNNMKATIKLVTRIDSSGKSVVFGGLYLAAESVPGSDPGNITKCLKGTLKKTNGYRWRDASYEDIDLFFQKMDQVDTSKLEWSELSTNARYDNLLKSIKLFKEWEAALEKYTRSLKPTL